MAAPPPVANAVAVAKKVAPKPAQKKVTAKPKPEEVFDVERSPDKEKQKDKKKEGDASNKKKLHTLTSVLTARSKVG